MVEFAFYVAGTVALLYSAAPALAVDVEQTRTLLDQNASADNE